MISVGAADSFLNKCDHEFNRRIEYVFPGHYLGCWLFVDIKHSEKSKK